MLDEELQPLTGGSSRIPGYGAGAVKESRRDPSGAGTKDREMSTVLASDVDLSLVYVDDAVHCRLRETPCSSEILHLNAIYFSWPWFICRLIVVILFIGRPYLLPDYPFACMGLGSGSTLADGSSHADSSADLSCGGSSFGIVVDLLAIFMQLIDFSVCARIFGLSKVFRNGSVPLLLAELLAATTALYLRARHWGHGPWEAFLFRGTRSFLYACRVYFLAIVSDSVLEACRNAIRCFLHIWIELSLPLLCILFFSCYVVAAFGGFDATFESLPGTFVRIFSLFTTSNNPDVWLHLYSQDWKNSVPFLIFIVAIVLLLQNFVVASIFSRFTDTLRMNYRERLASRRASLLRAFSSLRPSPRGVIEPASVYTLLQRLRPHYGSAKIQILYKAASPEDDFGMINFEAFCRILKSVTLRVRTGVIPDAALSPWLQLLNSALGVLSPSLTIVSLVVLSIRGNVWMHNKINTTMLLFCFLSFLGLLRSLVQSIALGTKRSLRSPWFHFMLIGDLITMFGVVSHFEAAGGQIRVNALGIVGLGQLISAMHIFKVFPSYYKVLCSCYDIIPGLVANAVPLLCVLHIFVCLGVWLFGGVVSENSDFGAGRGADPLYSLLDFGSYSNAAVVVINLLVVNNWIKIAAGLFYELNNSLLVYLYFGLFFTIAVMFCLHSLMAIFVGALLLNESDALVPMELVAVEKDSQYSRGYQGSRQRASQLFASYEVTSRSTDGGDILKIIETMQVSDFTALMDMMAHMFSVSLAAYKVKSGQVIFQSSAIEPLLLRYQIGDIDHIFRLILEQDLINQSHESSSQCSKQSMGVRPGISSGSLRWPLPGVAPAGSMMAASSRVRKLLEARYEIQRGSVSGHSFRDEHVVCTFKEISEAKI